MAMSGMRNGFVVFLFLLGALTSTGTRAHELNGDPTLQIATIKLSNYQEGIKNLVEQGLDIAGVNLQNSEVDVVLSQSALTALDMTTLGALVKTKTVDVSKAPDSKYLNYEKLTTALNNFAQQYPKIVSLESAGKTLEGRDIWAVHIANKETNSTNKPVIFFNAMHHAREVMTTEVAVDIIEQLVTTYEANPQVKEWVDKSEIWVVPMVNPDGNNLVWKKNNMWRKNARGGYGVDINRNYPYQWSACNGSSGSKYNDTYRGPSAASEPETNAIMNLVAKIKPALSISYHSYSELVLYPYSCDGERTPDHQTVSSIGQTLANLLPSDTGRGNYTPGTSWEILYAVDGGDIDWFYHEHNVLPYVIEINGSSQGFQPEYSWRKPTVEKMRKGWQYMLNRLFQSSVTGSIENFSGTGTVSVTSLNEESSATPKIHKIKSDGTFQIFVEPGMYRLQMNVGNQRIEKDVLVGAERSEVHVSL